MLNMTLERIAQACGGQLYGSPEGDPAEVTCVVLDSRKIEQGGLFVATEGANVDGHKFIGQVFEKGALAVVTEKTPEQVEQQHGIPAGCWGVWILVEDSLQALKDIAEYYRSQLSIPVIGITGSVGKTSTKEFIAGVLSRKYKVLKTEGNFNNEVGLPLTLLRIRPEHQAAVVEMGISDFGEMHRLSKMAKPDICVITNIGQCHLENLKSREGILKAKTEIFDFMSKQGRVCVNGDDDMLATLDHVKGQKVLRFGLGSGLDVYADAIEDNGLLGSKAALHLGEQTINIQVPLPGRHMVINATAAALVAGLLGLSPEQIREGIAGVEAVSGRSHIMRLEKYTVIDDCYNANPVSMKAAIDLLGMARGRKVAVLGDMFELGENSDALHAGVGRYAAEKGVDVILCTGENSRHMYAGALKCAGSGQQVQWFATRAELLEQLPGLLQEGDGILVKASHGMGFDKVVEALAKH
ncbi:MAG: UDP-N-acetylmuramoyl-tripeptide--D-alanyl-D-alanine ligase [Lachnospiraceae bacterium]|nr:UDP-N-acetylmuramoyl-tripeptide--D-alanyl-D-alanine ligase [Lachnospiraceae bacterium]